MVDIKIVLGEGVTGKISTQFINTPLESAFKILVQSSGCTFALLTDSIYVMKSKVEGKVSLPEKKRPKFL